jgi:formate-dependent nitrite reductase membrane component NrfD
MARARPTTDWVFGLLVGTLTGFALAMLCVEPYLITPNSTARYYVAVAGIAGATVVMAVRNRLAGQSSPPGGLANAEPSAAPDRGRGTITKEGGMR